MKTIIYEFANGNIVDIIDGQVVCDGLAATLKYRTSEMATGSETNISQLSDLMKMGHLVDTAKISQDTKDILLNATTVADIRSFLMHILQIS